MKTFEQFLRENLKEGFVDFALRASNLPTGDVAFYIHALGHDSETLDMRVYGDQLVPRGEKDYPPTINNGPTDRENLELLVYLAWDEGVISMSRGRELLGFNTMDDMREWLKAAKAKYLADFPKEKRT